MRNFLVLLILSAIPFCAYADTIRIDGISVQDEGFQGETGFTVDVEQIADCTPDSAEADLEDFFDSFMSVSIRNGLSSDFKVRRVRFVVRRSRANGGRYRSRRFPPSGNLVARGEETSDITFILADASNGGKRFTGSTDLISSDTGSLPIRVALFGSLAGKRIVLRGSTRISFRDVNRCS